MPSIIRHIHPVSQPQGSNLCWVAVTAMITRRHNTGVLDEIIAEARGRGVPIDTQNRLDETTGVPALARAFGLSHSRFPHEILAGSELSTRLRHAPVGLFGVLSSPPSGGTPRHAVAVHGVTGDFDSASSCNVLGVDPRGYSAINQSFFNLQTQFNVEWIMWKAS